MFAPMVPVPPVISIFLLIGKIIAYFGWVFFPTQLRRFNVLYMRKVIIFLLLISYTSVFAQSVRKQSQTVNSKKYAGYAITIEDTPQKVVSFWESYLDDLGKLRKKRDFLEISEFKIPDAFYPEAIYYSRSEAKDSTAVIWIALDDATLLAGEEGVSLVNTSLEAMMEGIGVDYQRYAMELRIMETEQAIDFQIREQEDLASNIESLGKKLANSKEERIRLQNMLDNLELSILATAQRIENNKLAIEEGTIDLEKMNGLLEKYRQQLIDLQ